MVARACLAQVLVRLAIRMSEFALSVNGLSVRLLDLAERAWPGEPPKPSHMSPADYTAASQALRAQAALDPAGKQRTGVRA